LVRFSRVTNGSQASNNSAPPVTSSPTPTYTSQPSSQVKLGDSDCNDIISPGDALLAFQFYLQTQQPSMSPCNQRCAADFNRDTVISPGDALCIFSAYLLTYTCGQPVMVDCGGGNTPAPPTKTPTPTVSGNLVYQNNFETYVSGSVGGHIVDNPDADPQLPGFVIFNDGGTWEPVFVNKDSSVKYSGTYALRFGVGLYFGTDPGIRGIGLWQNHQNAYALPAGVSIRATVWAKTDATSLDFCHIVFTHVNGNRGDWGSVNPFLGVWDEKDECGINTSYPCNEWRQLQINFTSNTNTANGDLFFLAFAANPKSKSEIHAWFDEMRVYRQ